MAQGDEHRALVGRWLKRTQDVLLEEIDRLEVKESGDLKRGLSAKVTERGEGIIHAEISFLTRGRFVDMGAGSGSKAKGLNKRKAKKWYSPAFYGRLSYLQGALGYAIMEEASLAITSNIDGTERG